MSPATQIQPQIMPTAMYVLCMDNGECRPLRTSPAIHSPKGSTSDHFPLKSHPLDGVKENCILPWRVSGGITSLLHSSSTDSLSELDELPYMSLHLAHPACYSFCLNRDSPTRNLDALDMHRPGGQALTMPIDLRTHKNIWSDNSDCSRRACITPSAWKYTALDTLGMIVQSPRLVLIILYDRSILSRLLI